MLALRVARIAAVTPRIKSVELVAADGGALPAFTAGAHIDVALGNGETRSYSLLNDPTETQRYAIARAARGPTAAAARPSCTTSCARATCSSPPPPANNFPLNEAGERHILIAGGIGITPLMAMSRRLAALGRRVHPALLRAQPRRGGRSSTSSRRRSGRASSPHFDGGDISRGLDVAALLKERPAAAHVYVCGPPGLIRAVREAAAHWPKGTVHYELFRGSEADIAPRSTDQPFDDRAQARRQDAARAGRQEHPADARRGRASRSRRCARRASAAPAGSASLEGSADHRDEVLTDEERERNIQVCVSRALPGETLVLDL